MNKASRILYIVGAIFGFITALVFFIVAIVYFVFSIKPGTPKSVDDLKAYMDFCDQVYKFARMDPAKNTLDEALAANRASGVMFIILGLILIPAGVVALVAKSFPGRNLPIHIVATVLNFDSLAMVGGILGIISAAMNLGKGNGRKQE